MYPPNRALLATLLCGAAACGHVAESLAQDTTMDAPIVDSGTEVPPTEVADANGSCLDLPGAWTKIFDSGSRLVDISATRKEDAWALGEALDMVFHWDGSGWSRLSKKVGSNPRGAQTIWANGPNDVWVADFTHWDGTAWSDWPGVPSIGSGVISGLWGSGPGDMWTQSEGYFTGSMYNDLIYWDGTSWAERGKWSEPGDFGEVNAHTLHGSTNDDVWAIDRSDPVRWDGTSLVHVEKPPLLQLRLWVGGATDVWAAGVTPGMTSVPGLAHFDGASWVVDTFRPTGPASGLWGSATDLWSVGSGGSMNHWDGRAWCRIDLGEKDDLGAISGSAPLDIWAIGVSAIYHYGPR